MNSKAVALVAIALASSLFSTQSAEANLPPISNLRPREEAISKIEAAKRSGEITVDEAAILR